VVLGASNWTSLAVANSQCSLAYTTKGAPFSDQEEATIRGFFLNNLDIQGSGAVVAAPDHHTGPGGDYYFHWERDGALSMNALMVTAASPADVKELFDHYTAWVKKVQNQDDPHDIDVRTEPKYTIPDGKPFTGAWCRPQTDGPGLRARTIASYALKVVEESNGGDAQPLWDLVKKDLEWVVQNWRQSGCDLWEEIQSDDFFWGRYTMRAGLHAGALLADKMGDKDAASSYRNTMKDIEQSLGSHYNGDFVFEAENRQKDSATIEAFNVGDLNDGMFSPLSKEVLGTIITLNDLFCNSFAINTHDQSAGVPGILYGRYEGDTYDGGNPWVLLSASLANLIYKQAGKVLNGVDGATYELLQRAYDIPGGLDSKALSQALLGAADGVMMRIRYHTEGNGFHMSEQMDRNTGFLTSAKDLTWNYANFLKALKARRETVQLQGQVDVLMV